MSGERISALESVSLKLKRAADHIKEVDAKIAAYRKSMLHEVAPNAEGKETIHVRDFPPAEISVPIGEVLYQIRSSLDYLAFDLVKLNAARIQLPTDWEEHCYFPLWLDTPKNPPTYNCFKRTLPGISKPAFTFIEAVQPYNRGQGGLFGVAMALWILGKLSNVDKHRYPHLTIPNIGQFQEVTTEWGGLYISYRTLRSGAETQPALSPDQTADAVDVETSYASHVTFEESILGPALGEFAVQTLLEACLDVTQNTIVPAFVEFLKKP